MKPRKYKPHEIPADTFDNGADALEQLEDFGLFTPPYFCEMDKIHVFPYLPKDAINRNNSRGWCIFHSCASKDGKRFVYGSFGWCDRKRANLHARPIMIVPSDDVDAGLPADALAEIRASFKADKMRAAIQLLCSD